MWIALVIHFFQIKVRRDWRRAEDKAKHRWSNANKMYHRQKLFIWTASTCAMNETKSTDEKTKLGRSKFASIARHFLSRLYLWELSTNNDFCQFDFNDHFWSLRIRNVYRVICQKKKEEKIAQSFVCRIFVSFVSCFFSLFSSLTFYSSFNKRYFFQVRYVYTGIWLWWTIVLSRLLPFLTCRITERRHCLRSVRLLFWLRNFIQNRWTEFRVKMMPNGLCEHTIVMSTIQHTTTKEIE